jgi:hypothetical protein
MTVSLHRRSPEVRLQQTTLLSATLHGFAAAPDLLGHLTESTRQAVLDLGRTRDYSIGELLFQQGDPHNGIYLISSGLVRSFYVSWHSLELEDTFRGAARRRPTHV